MSFHDGPGRMQLGETVLLMKVSEYDMVETEDGNTVQRTYKIATFEVFGDYTEVLVPPLSLVEAPLTTDDFTLKSNRHLADEQKEYLIEVATITLATHFGWFSP